MSLKFARCLLFLALYCGLTVARIVPRSGQNIGVFQLQDQRNENQEQEGKDMTVSGRQIEFQPDWRYCKIFFGLIWCPMIPGNPPVTPSTADESAETGEQEELVDPTNPANLPASLFFPFPGFPHSGHHHYPGYHHPGYHYPRPTEPAARPTRTTTTTTTARPENCKTIKHLGYTLCIKSSEAST